MSRVTYANLFSEARNNVVTLLSSQTNVDDPTTSTSEFRKWIYSREPDVKASDFAGYPFIIIHPASFTPTDKGSLDMKSKNVAWDIEIEIVTSDRGYSGADGKGLTHMDAISNDVMETLLNKTNRVTLQGYSMYFSMPVTTDVVSEIISDERVYRRSILCAFRSRMQVSV